MNSILDILKKDWWTGMCESCQISKIYQGWHIFTYPKTGRIKLKAWQSMTRLGLTDSRGKGISLTTGHQRPAFFRTEEQRLRSRIICAERWHVWCLNLGETLDCDGHGLSVRQQDSGNEPRYMWRPLQIDPPRPSADSVLWHIQCCVSSEFSFSHQWAQKYRTDWY